MELPTPRYPEFTSKLPHLVFAIVCSIDIRLALYAHRTSLVNCAPLLCNFFERDYAAY